MSGPRGESGWREQRGYSATVVYDDGRIWQALCLFSARSILRHATLVGLKCTSENRRKVRVTPNRGEHLRGRHGDDKGKGVHLHHALQGHDEHQGLSAAG